MDVPAPRPPRRLLILGIGHVFPIGPQVRMMILGESPSAVCLELDARRLHALSQPANVQAAVPKHGPRLYRRLARFQRAVADQLQTTVGDEMRFGLQAARAVGARVELIDLDAASMIARIQRGMGPRERLRLVWDLLTARLRRGGKTSDLRNELERIQRDPMPVLEEMGQRFPTIKRVLIDERNQHMAVRLRAVLAEHGHVVALVGDGHVPGITSLLADLEPAVVRLKQLSEMAPTPTVIAEIVPGGAGSGFSFETSVADDFHAND